MRVLGLCFAALLVLQNVSAGEDKPDFPNDLYYHHHPHKVHGHYVDTSQKAQPVKEGPPTIEFVADPPSTNSNGPQVGSSPNQPQGQPQNLAQAPPPEASTNVIPVNMAVDGNGASPDTSSNVAPNAASSAAPSASQTDSPPAAQSSAQADQPAVTYNADGGIVLPDSAENSASTESGAVPPNAAQSSPAPAAAYAPAANAAPAPAVNAAPAMAAAPPAPQAPPASPDSAKNPDGSPITYDDNGAIVWPEKPSNIAASVANAAAVPAQDNSAGNTASNLSVNPETLPLHASTRRSKFNRILLADADNTHDGTDFMGMGTFYDLETRAGECGEKHKNTELVAALNIEQMGANKEECNKEIELMGPNENKVRVKVVDICKTCGKGDLDLSPKAFESIGEFGHGGVSIKWHFV